MDIEDVGPIFDVGGDESNNEEEKGEVSMSTVSSTAFLVGQAGDGGGAKGSGDKREDEEGHLPPVEAERSPWGSLWIANVVSFLCAVQFSVFFSSLWPYLQEIDKTATPGFFGWVISGYSIGQMFSSPLFGRWSNRIKNTRIPVAVGLCILIAANFLYVFVEAFPSHRKWILLVARILVGVGAGNLSVLRAYVATASLLKDRSRAIILSTAAFTLGFMMGPGMQSAFSSLDYPGYVYGPIHIDMYTAPGYFSNLANFAAIVVVLAFLKESYAGIVPQTTRDDPLFALPTFDRTAVAVLIGSWFAMLFANVNIETVSSPYSMVMWDWTKKEALTYNGLILFASAAISFFVYVAYIFVWSKWVNERVSIVLATLMIALFWLVSYPWPFLTGTLDLQSLPAAAANSTAASVTMITATISGGSTAAPVGCPPQYHWCPNTKKVPLGLYLGAFPLLSIAVPMGNIAIATLYSKVLGPRRQGLMQGVLTAFGSLSRAIGPILMSYMFELFGPRASWLLCAATMFASVFPYIFLYQRLVPLDPRPSLAPGQRYRYKRGYLYRF